MKYYKSIQTVIIDPLIIKKALDFSTRVVSTTDYADSNQFSFEKVKNDHFISKLGEEAAKSVLCNYAEVTGPDYNIYIGKRKSWDDDLYVRNTGLAIKTQKRSTAAKFGLSWTFQCGLSRSDVILKRPEAWVVFVEYDDLVGNVCNVYPPFQMKELILGEPVLAKLKGHKKVVYAAALPL